MRRHLRPRAAAAFVVATTMVLTTPARADGPGVEHLFRDGFRDGFSAGSASPWSLYRYDGHSGGSYVADDGVVGTSPRDGLSVGAAGTNAATGTPAFTRTMAQEDDNPFGLPGQLDHYKWLAFGPASEAVADRELVVETSFGGRVLGAGGHPFGSAVADPDDDPRLGALASLAFDADTQLGFGFLLTNRRIYAWYERQPFGRDRLGDYAAFTYAIPLAERGPEPWADVAIAYDPSTATIRWLIGNREQFRIRNPGALIDRRWMILDNGGTPAAASPRQLAPGFGMLTYLDGASSGGPGLVRLSNLPSFYFDTATGQPAPQLFLDNSSAERSRLFGQGAELKMRQVEVTSRAVRP